jgi:selenocysteine-specific elongation factor
VHVIATAGHVDHGKSTLVRALTGMEPDRWAEERRRGMTIDLGFAWTTIGGDVIAFVDVPGHERFVPTMLAGVGSVPAALIVVAADEGWMPQTQEHVAALDALAVQHAVLAITRSDLADPGAAMADARARLARTSVGEVEAVSVAVRRDGDTRGLDELRAALSAMVRRLPPPEVSTPPRLWVDRSFSVQGTGTVVTGTLAAGSLSLHDTVVLASTGRELHVRGLQTLGKPADRVTAVARVAVNLRGIEKHEVRRGDALIASGSWPSSAVFDVRLNGELADPLAGDLMVHIGSAALAARLRPLGDDTARLTLAIAIPVAVGDRLLLRDPGRHQIVAGAEILDADPPPLNRRGAASARGRELASSEPADAASVVQRRGIVRGQELRSAGIAALPAPFTGDWLVDAARAATLRDRLHELISQHWQQFPLEPGPSVEAVRRGLELPDRALVAALVETATGSSLAIREGRVVDVRREHALPPAVATAVAAITARLAASPFDAPEAGELAELGLGPRELAAAERAGLLLRIAPGVVLAPDAETQAVQRLETLPQPFSVSEARQVLATTRRVAVPLLEMLDRARLTQRLPDATRRVMNQSRVDVPARGSGAEKAPVAAEGSER